MNAIILAAGVGRRLAPLTDTTNKCLLSVGDQPLLSRMLAGLESVGIDEAILVVGHCQDQVRRVGGSRRGRMRVRYVENPDYTKGAVLSLHAARAFLGEPVIVMDADVLFPREFLRRLVAAPAPSAVLVDLGFEDTGEEQKYYSRGQRVIAIGKKIVPESYERVGEGVGFFKCGAEAGPHLVTCVEKVLTEAHGYGEWEDAVNLLVASRHVGSVDVTGLPWTEIDFVEDLRRARDEVLPHVVRLDGA